MGYPNLLFSLPHNSHQLEAKKWACAIRWLTRGGRQQVTQTAEQASIPPRLVEFDYGPLCAPSWPSLSAQSGQLSLPHVLSDTRIDRLTGWVGAGAEPPASLGWSPNGREATG